MVPRHISHVSCHQSSKLDSGKIIIWKIQRNLVDSTELYSWPEVFRNKGIWVVGTQTCIITFDSKVVHT